MSSVADWAGQLEDRERVRSGVPRVIARKSVARRLGIAPGTLENIARGRTKGVRDWVRDRIHAAIVNETKLEIGRLEHELEKLVLCGVDTREKQIGAVRSHLEACRGILSGDDK